jgi:hypothetical protein
MAFEKREGGLTGPPRSQNLTSYSADNLASSSGCRRFANRVIVDQAKPNLPRLPSARLNRSRWLTPSAQHVLRAYLDSAHVETEEWHVDERSADAQWAMSEDNRKDVLLDEDFLDLLEQSDVAPSGGGSRVTVGDVTRWGHERKHYTKEWEYAFSYGTHIIPEEEITLPRLEDPDEIRNELAYVPLSPTLIRKALDNKRWRTDEQKDMLRRLADFITTRDVDLTALAAVIDCCRETLSRLKGSNDMTVMQKLDRLEAQLGRIERATQDLKDANGLNPVREAEQILEDAEDELAA